MRYVVQEVDNWEAIKLAANFDVHETVASGPALVHAQHGAPRNSIDLAILKSKDPIYLQLAEIMRERIFTKQWTAGSKIPSEHELMSVFGVARGTVRFLCGGSYMALVGFRLHRLPPLSPWLYINISLGECQYFFSSFLEKLFGSVLPSPAQCIPEPDGCWCTFIYRANRTPGGTGGFS